MRKLKLIIAIVCLAGLFWSNIIWHGVTLAILLTFTLPRLIELKSLKFWGIFAIVSLLPSIALRSQAIFYLSLFIFFRSIILYLALILLTESIPANFAKHYLTKILGARFATTLALAFNLVPIIRHLLIKNYSLYYFRKVNNYAKIKVILSYSLAIFRQILAAANCCAENMLLTEQVKYPQIFIISGPRHSGKTTLLTQLITTHAEYNWPISGILAPSTMLNDRRSSIFVQNVATQDKCLLASRDELISDVFYEYGGFNFSQQGYEFAKNALGKVFLKGIVAFDEYGPLEFANLGYANEFEQLLSKNISAVFIVIRDELLDRFVAKYHFLPYEIIYVSNAECKCINTAALHVSAN